MTITPSNLRASMSAKPQTFVSVNPATEDEIARFDVFSDEAIERAIVRAGVAAAQLKALGFERRAERLRALGAVLLAERESLAATITAEMGRPLTEAATEIDKSAECCGYYAEIGPAELAEEATPSSTSKASKVVFEPLGPVMLIAPWNLPVWQVLRFAVPCLMAGNPVLLKHAPNVSGCGLALERMVEEAGFPAGAFTTLLVDVPQAERIVVDPRIRLVAVTGSTATGARIASLAGSVVKKCLLELGGSDVFIVLDDADVERAAIVGARSRFLNAGQTCIAAKRFLVAERIAERFEAAVADIAEKLVVGDPTSRVDMGPLARADLRDRIEEQIGRTIGEGARVLTGGGRAAERGYFIQPTVLAGCRPEMTAFQEETFGPVLSIMRVRDADHAVDVANASPYGLGAAIWTSDLAAGEVIATRLETGGAFINGMTHSDPRLPFGGVKSSGYGRDLGRFVLAELLNIKTIWRPG